MVNLRYRRQTDGKKDTREALRFRPGARTGKESSPMLNFEEELSKFKPSKEVEQAEDAIVNMNLKDMTDILIEILNEKEKR